MAGHTILLNLIGGVALLLWRSRSAERPFRLSLPARWRSRRRAASAATVAFSPRRTVVVVRIPQFRIPVPRPKLLDWYVSSLFAKVLGLAFFGLLGIFYISTFIDLSAVRDPAVVLPRVAAALGVVEGVGAAARRAPRENLTTDPYYTDGRRIVLVFDRRPISLSEIEILPWLVLAK